MRKNAALSKVLEVKKTWNAKQLKAFLESTGGDRLSSLYHVLAMTGMRRGEGVGLRWDDVDLEACRLSVRRALIPHGSGVIISEPKMAKGRRSVALDADQEEWGGAWVGEPFHPQSLSRSFERALGAAKLPRIRLHDLRHTHATLGAPGRRPRQGGLRAPRSRDHLDHARHLLARHPRDAGRGGGADRGAGVRRRVGCAVFARRTRPAT